MKIKHAVGILIVLFLLTGVSAALVQRGVASAEAFETSSLPEAAPSLQSPFPDITIPGVPDKGDCCLWQIERRVDGKREAKFGNPYVCDMGQTRRGEMTIKMKLKFPGGPCDQQDIPTDNSTLEARGVVIRQNDQYAYFSGEFSITDPAGKVLFKGRIETTDRFGSHHLFSRCEQCRPPSHFEGWLVGRGTDAFPHHTLRALIVSRGTVPSPTTSSTVMLGSLTGTLIKCP